MASTSLATVASLLFAQAAPPLDRPGAASQAWPFLVAGLVILAVVIWGVAGGIRRRHRGL